MALARQTFDHDSPSAPTRTIGALLGASGVSHPPLQVIGTLSGTSSSDGSFSDANGYGQIAYDSSGYMYVADYSNNRVQRFLKNSSGVWAFDSKFTSVVTVLGGGSSVSLVDIDRSVSPNQIHIASNDHYTASNWISVWSVADWPNLTTLNRLRQYGANAASSTANRSEEGLSLRVNGTTTVVTSFTTPFSIISWNNQTGALLVETTKGSAYGRFATDGSTYWNTNNGAEIGLRTYNPSTWVASTRLDSATANTFRPNRFYTGSCGTAFYYNGKVYGRDLIGTIHAWNSSSNAYLDVYALPGSLGPSNIETGLVGANQVTLNPLRQKADIVIDQDSCAWIVGWENNSDNANVNNCFLRAQPITSSVATWTKTDWSAGTNTLYSISVKGTLIAGEKYKIRIRKNSGSWTTITSDLLQDATTIQTPGTFTSGDTLTVELSLSTWDRLDGHATLYATKDKLSPTNVAVELVYNDSSADVYVPVPTAGFTGNQGATGQFIAVQGA